MPDRPRESGEAVADVVVGGGDDDDCCVAVVASVPYGVDDDYGDDSGLSSIFGGLRLISQIVQVFGTEPSCPSASDCVFFLQQEQNPGFRVPTWRKWMGEYDTT